MPVRPLEFVTLPTGCHVPRSHRLNQDGYFRYTFGSYRKGAKTAVMFHRLIWEARNGPIPAGQEVNHKCNNRACANVAHMELLGSSEHKALTNRLRYLPPSQWGH